MTDSAVGPLGFGIGWRPELASFIAENDTLFIEVIAENVIPARFPPSLDRLVNEGRTIIPHGIRLSLGGAESPDPRRLEHLAAVAARVGAPLVSEHIAFARAHGVEAGHVLPVARTGQALEVIVENVLSAQGHLAIPLALEHVAALVEWPDPEMTETEFVREILARTGANLLLDLSNLHANAINHGFDAVDALHELPLDQIAYVHVGGGVVRGGRYYDTHTDPVVPEVLELVTELCASTAPPGILLERDDNFPDIGALHAELDAIRTAAELGATQRATRAG